MKLKTDSASGYRFSAVATLAAVVAGITSLSGILQLRLSGLAARPLIEVERLPESGWTHTWLRHAQNVRALQADAVAEWLNVVLMLLAVIVLIASISALIGFFAYATARRYEVALSAVVGASHRRLRYDQLQRAAVNAALALGLGGAAGLLTASVANRMWPHSSNPIAPATWLALSVLAAGGIAALAARAAARRMSRPGWLGDAIAPEARTNPGYGAEDLRRALLHAQFAFTFALLTAALLVAQNARIDRHERHAAGDAFVTRVEIGTHMPPLQRKAILQTIQREIAGGARKVAIASPGTLIGVGPMDHVYSKCGRCYMSFMYTPLFPLRTQQHAVSEGFFGVAGFKVMRGREFEASDGDSRYVVVNDTFAMLAFQGQNPIGKEIKVGGLGGVVYTVIGVIEDIPIAGLTSFAPDTRSVVRSNRLGHEPAIYFNTAEKPPVVFDVVTNNPVDLQLAGGTTMFSKRGREVIADARAPSAWFAGMLGALSVAAAIIALFSLGAITLLNVRQQEPEIAARRAVGARRRDIVSMIIRNTVAIAGRGMLVGVILSLAIARAIQMVLPQIELIDFGVLVIAATLLTLVSLLAAIIPARAAASVPPAQVHV